MGEISTFNGGKINRSFEDKYKSIDSYKNVIKKQNIAKLAYDSIKYCEELGYPINKLLININQVGDLTGKESRILQMLMDRRGEIVTYDEIATVLWGERMVDKFSLYAINKLFDRLRLKLQVSSINSNIIQSERGVGYLLYD